MTNEAVIVELGANGGTPIRYTVSNTEAIAKGALMVISGVRTATAAGRMAAPFWETFAGIAAAEKVASDGATTLSCYTTGIFDLTNQATAIPNGACVKCSGANKYVVCDSAVDIISGMVIGKLLEPGTASVANLVKIGVVT